MVQWSWADSMRQSISSPVLRSGKKNKYLWLLNTPQEHEGLIPRVILQQPKSFSASINIDREEIDHRFWTARTGMRNPSGLVNKSTTLCAHGSRDFDLGQITTIEKGKEDPVITTGFGHAYPPGWNLVNNPG